MSQRPSKRGSKSKRSKKKTHTHDWVRSCAVDACVCVHGFIIGLNVVYIECDANTQFLWLKSFSGSINHMFAYIHSSMSRNSNIFNWTTIAIRSHNSCCLCIILHFPILCIAVLCSVLCSALFSSSFVFILLCIIPYSTVLLNLHIQVKRSWTLLSRARERVWFSADS